MILLEKNNPKITLIVLYVDVDVNADKFDKHSIIPFLFALGQL